MSIRSATFLAKNIKYLRKRKKYSLEKVSKLADLSLNTVAKIESGKNKNPTIGTLLKLCSALGIELDDLISTCKNKDFV